MLLIPVCQKGELIRLRALHGYYDRCFMIANLGTDMGDKIGTIANFNFIHGLTLMLPSLSLFGGGHY